MSKICVFDTETVNLEKPFCYNIGYVIYDTDEKAIALKRDYVVEQVWHNPMLFTTAYYANKKEGYISAMRSRKTVMEKFGYICQQMIRDFKEFEISLAYAYNSSFDERVFAFNCDWFKCNNPFDNVKVLDIRGNAVQFLVDDFYKAFCEDNGYFTESKNYSSTAEVMYRYITKKNEFIEAHTALADSEIELEILKRTVEKGAEIGTEYTAPKSIPRAVPKKLTIRHHGKIILETEYLKRMEKKDTIYLN